MITRKQRLTLFAVMLTLLFAAFAAVLIRGVRVETDILKLIPRSASSELSETAEQFSRSQTGELVCMVTAPSGSEAAAAAKIVDSMMIHSGLFSSVSGRVRESDQQIWYRSFHPARWGFLSPSLREELQGDEPDKALIRNLQQNLYSPVPDFYGSALETDPFLLFPTFMQSLFDSENDLIDGYAVTAADTLSAVVLTGTLIGSPFDGSVQDSAEQLITALSRETVRQGGTFSSTGIVRFAGESFARAKKEMSVIGSLSMLGILGILLFAFRSFPLLLTGLMPIAVGTAAGFTVTALFFPNLHIIALTMGGSLTGIAADYSLHYLASVRWGGENPETVLKKVFPGISLGALTTLIGYAALAFSGFPGLQQIALFTAAGITAAWAAVILGFPLIIRPTAPIPLKKIRSIPRSVLIPTRIITAALLTAITAAGFVQFRTDDSLSALRSPMELLDREESRIRSAVQGIESSRFIIVSARSQEQLLEICEQTALRLDSLVNKHVLGGYFSVTDAVISRKQWSENRSVLEKAVTGEGGAVQAELAQLGFDDSVYSRICSEIRAAEYHPETFLRTETAKPWSRLILEKNGSFSAVILLRDVKNGAALKKNFDSGAARYLDRIEEISGILGSYRHSAGVLLMISYAVILILLCGRYGVLRGIRCFGTSVLAGAAVIGGLVLAGTAINFMHIMALLMVLAIGVDNTIFFAEGSDHRTETYWAVILSGISTVLAFGVLILSATPALQAIGMVITPGIILSALLAILFSDSNETSTATSEPDREYLR